MAQLVETATIHGCRFAACVTLQPCASASRKEVRAAWVIGCLRRCAGRERAQRSRSLPGAVLTRESASNGQKFDVCTRLAPAAATRNRLGSRIRPL
jgi:hypothetical protein